MSSPERKAYFESVALDIDASLKRVGEYNQYLTKIAKLEQEMSTDRVLVLRRPDQLNEQMTSVLLNLTQQTLQRKGRTDISQSFGPAAATLDGEFQVKGTEVHQLTAYAKVRLPTDDKERKAYLEAAFRYADSDGRGAIASGQFVEGLKVWRLIMAFIPTAATAAERNAAFKDKNYAVLMNIGGDYTKASRVSFSHLDKGKSQYAKVDKLIFPLKLSSEMIYVSSPDIIKSLKVKEGAKEIEGDLVMKEMLNAHGVDTNVYHSHSYWEGTMKEEDDNNTTWFIPHGACMDAMCPLCYDMYVFQYGSMKYSKLFGQKIPPTPRPNDRE